MKFVEHKRYTPLVAYPVKKCKKLSRTLMTFFLLEFDLFVFKWYEKYVQTIHRDITDRGDKPAWNLSARARERVIWRIRLSFSNAVRVDKDRKNLPSSLSFALTEFADWRYHLQSSLWLVSSICNISME